MVIWPRMWCLMHWLNLNWFRQERYQFQGYRRNLAAFREAVVRLLHGQEFGWRLYELAVATRFSLPRRVLGTRSQAAIGRVSAMDNWLTAKAPHRALYMVSALAAPRER